MILRRSGDLRSAEAAFVVAYRIATSCDLALDKLIAAVGIVAARNRMGRPSEFAGVDELERASNVPRSTRAEVATFRADNMVLEGASPLAILAEYRRALRLVGGLSPSVYRLWIHRRIAELWLSLGRLGRAERHWTRAMGMVSPDSETEDRLALERLRAELDSRNGDPPGALVTLQALAEKATRTGFQYEALLASHRASELARRLGDDTTARLWWEETRRLADVCGARDLLERWRKEDRAVTGVPEASGDREPIPATSEGESVALPNILSRTLPRLDLPAHGIVTRSALVEQQANWIARIAPTSLPVLIRGETGTGKELFATLVHALSPRRRNRFIGVNCAALPEEIIESELFGHRRGAFTGATEDEAGLVAETHRGTLFLDEIGELPPKLQPKLLRAIELGEIRQVGDTRNSRVDVRVVAATNQRVEEAIAKGRFREDLYYRLKGLEITLPPLRERPEDIPLLAEHFLARMNRRFGTSTRLARSTLAWMSGLPWRGNVRELKYSIERAAAIAGPDAELVREHFGVSGPDPAPAAELDVELEAVERSRIVMALESADWNLTRAARALGLSRTTLSGRIQRLGIRRPL